MAACLNPDYPVNGCAGDTMSWQEHQYLQGAQYAKLLQN